MINIRSSVFETNSSSVHAMIVTLEKTLPDNDLVVFNFGEFGWEESAYYGIREKASYLYTAAYSLYGEKAKIKIQNALSKYHIRCYFDEPCTDKWHEIGYIDHAYGTSDFVDSLLADPDMMIRFLFNLDSFVVTSNDNTDMNWYRKKCDVDYPHDKFVKGN